MSADLLDWLRAQLDDDERAARATVPGRWELSHDGAHVHSPDEGLTVMENIDDPGPWLRALPAFMTRWDPTRVLAEVDAKRRILDQLTDVLDQSSEWFTVESCDEVDAILAEKILRLLALPYAHLPGYRPVWAPGRAPGR